MRVAILSHSSMSVYYFRRALIEALEQKKVEVFVLVPRDEYSSRLENLGFKLVYYEFQRQSLNPFVILSNFMSLKKVLKGLNLDLLQSSAHKSNTFGILAAFCAKIPHKLALVEGLGSFYISEGFKAAFVRFVINFLYKIVFKIADKFIFVNQSDANFMQNLGLQKEKICVIKSVGINLQKFFPYRISDTQRQAFLKEFNMPNKPIVLMLARALWHKGIREFYQAASLLKERANFVLVGGIDENLSCASLDFLQSGAVYYLGHREDVPFLLNLCDIFVLPSYKEGFPVSVLEAKACAKACVVSDCEGCVEAVQNGFDGLWAKTKDYKDLASKISLLLDDEHLRLNLAKNAFENALKYDEKVIAQKYLKLYEELCCV